MWKLPKCERCCTRMARSCVADQPDNDGALLFGDELVGLLLCDPCLRITQADGDWYFVVDLEAEVIWPEATIIPFPVKRRRSKKEAA